MNNSAGCVVLHRDEKFKKPIAAVGITGVKPIQRIPRRMTAETTTTTAAAAVAETPRGVQPTLEATDSSSEELPGAGPEQPETTAQTTPSSNASSLSSSPVAANHSQKMVRWKEPESFHEDEESSTSTSSSITLPQHVGLDQDEQQQLRHIHLIQQHQESEEQIRRKKITTLLSHVDVTSSSGRLLMINLSRRGLWWKDATTIKDAMLQNPNLSVLKLSYNHLGDRGAAVIAAGFLRPNNTKHPSLATLDLGFNCIKDAGCATLALHAVAGNTQLTTLYLSGNHIQEKGAMAIAGAILHGCSLTTLHLSQNSVGRVGVETLARAMAEREALCIRAPQQPGEIRSKERKTMEELHLVGTKMQVEGFVTLSSMLLTNFSIRILSLSNNGVDDNAMALLAQSLSRNKTVPLEVLNLSFNEITCIGVECLMNAVWGSRTIREFRLDNNKIRDRGGQLAAVVLTSIQVRALDLSFNKITTVAIKALMKSVSENSSIQYLGLCGIPIDPNASKALSYGLAYNSSLKFLHVDNCQVGYSAQRHIVAGIVSNRNAALRMITGFAIGAITVTLGLPQVLEGWTNDQCLSFIRLMWKQWREENGIDSLHVQVRLNKPLGPAPPAAVVRAAKMALAILGHDGAASLNTEPHQKEVSETSPLVQTNAIMLERTLSGTVCIPEIAQEDGDDRIEAWSETIDQNKVAPATPRSPQCDPAQKSRNLSWLRKHFQSLHEVGRLPFNNADLWQLHQYFFSPLVPVDDDSSNQREQPSVPSSNGGMTSTPGNSSIQASSEADNEYISPAVRPKTRMRAKTPQSSLLPGDVIDKATLGRALSFQQLSDAVAVGASRTSSLSSSIHSRRRSLEVMDEVSHVSSEKAEPASKRAKNFKPRIAYYPRIREVLETDKPQDQVLSLLRQLKLVESIMFNGRNIYAENDVVRMPDQLTPADVEMIILDLL